jgi:hypothetical protein
MVPASFDAANCVLDKPPEMSYDQCDPLSVLRTKTDGGNPVCISCWKVTKEELEEIIRTGRVWLTVYGFTMPPCALTGEVPFTTEDDNGHR